MSNLQITEIGLQSPISKKKYDVEAITSLIKKAQEKDAEALDELLSITLPNILHLISKIQKIKGKMLDVNDQGDMIGFSLQFLIEKIIPKINTEKCYFPYIEKALAHAMRDYRDDLILHIHIPKYIRLPVIRLWRKRVNWIDGYYPDPKDIEEEVQKCKKQNKENYRKCLIAGYRAFWACKARGIGRHSYKRTNVLH